MPLAAGGQPIQNGVDEFAQGLLGWDPAAFAFASVERSAEQRFEESPLFVGQVAGIRFALVHSERSMPQLAFLRSLLRQAGIKERSPYFPCAWSW